MEDFHSHLHLVKLYPARPDLIPPAATAHTGPAPLLPLNLPPSYNRRRWSSLFFWRPLCKLRLVHGLGTALNITCTPDSSPLRSTHTLGRPAYVTAIGRSFATTAGGGRKGKGEGLVRVFPCFVLLSDVEERYATNWLKWEFGTAEWGPRCIMK